MQMQHQMDLQRHERNEPDPRIWRELPKAVLHRVLGDLPFVSVMRFRCVCKTWKKLFASPTFYHYPSHRAFVFPWVLLVLSKSRIGKNRIGSESAAESDEYQDQSDGSVDADSQGQDYFPLMDSKADLANNNALGNDMKEVTAIFDCESGSWRPPWAIPPVLRDTVAHNLLSAGAIVCAVRDQILIVGESFLHIYSPISSACKKLPPFLSIKGCVEAIGFANENVDSQSLQVVAVGKARNGGDLAVEMYCSSKGSWHVCGDITFTSPFLQEKMVYCSGCFYALSGSDDKRPSLVAITPSPHREWAFPNPSDPNGSSNDRSTQWWDARLIGCRNRVYVIGITLTSPGGLQHGFDGEDWQKHCHWDIVILQFYPVAETNACWNLITRIPRNILDVLYLSNGFADPIYHGFVTPECHAHGDTIFFECRDSRHFLMYDLCKDLWRFSPQAKYSIRTIALVWEPVVINCAIPDMQ